MLKGIDISNNNKGLKLADTNLLYVMKATQGISFVDKYCDPWVQWFAPKVSDNNFAASVLTNGSYCAVFINYKSVSVFGKPSENALISWSSSTFGSAV